MALVAVYVLILSLLPTATDGDVPDYLYLVVKLCSSGPLPEFKAMRSWGYPLFYCATTINQTFPFGLFLAQAAVFIAALWVAIATFAPNRYALLVIAAACIPYYAYLQKLIYPDGLIASLLLLYLSALARQRWVATFALAASLVFVKLVFVFLFAHVAYLLARDRFALSARTMALSAIFGAFIAMPLAFPQVAYMAALVRANADLDRVIPEQVTVWCNGHPVALTRDRMELKPIRDIWQQPHFGPLQEAEAISLSCSKKDLDSASRAVLLASYAQDPAGHIARAAGFFAASMVGLSTFRHASSMLARETTFGFKRSYFAAVAYFIIKPAVTISAIALIWIAIRRRRPKWHDLIDWPAMVLISFLVAHSVAIATSAAVLSDRYIFPNFLAFCLLAARVAHHRHPQLP